MVRHLHHALRTKRSKIYLARIWSDYRTINPSGLGKSRSQALQIFSKLVVRTHTVFFAIQLRVLQRVVAWCTAADAGALLVIVEISSGMGAAWRTLIGSFMIFLTTNRD